MLVPSCWPGVDACAHSVKSPGPQVRPSNVPWLLYCDRDCMRSVISCRQSLYVEHCSCGLSKCPWNSSLVTGCTSKCDQWPHRNIRSTQSFLGYLRLAGTALGIHSLRHSRWKEDMRSSSLCYPPWMQTAYYPFRNLGIQPTTILQTSGRQKVIRVGRYREIIVWSTTCTDPLPDQARYILLRTADLLRCHCAENSL